MNNADWYSPEDWYAPLKKPETALTAAAADEKKKKKRTGPRIAAGLFLLLVLIVGTSLAFRDSGEGIAVLLPENSVPENSMPENSRDFFNSYYTSTTADKADIRIEKIKYTGSYIPEPKSAEGEELTMQELYSNGSGSVVGILGYADGKIGYAWGTGIVLSEDGLILTNTHIIDGCDRAAVTLSDETEVEAKLIGADSVSDIALLKIEAQGLKPAELGLSDSLTVGDRVAAIGNPLGKDFRLTFTDGIISAIERDVSYNGRSMTLLQTNTALNEGNSGGPLFNMFGQVVGVTNMKMMSSYSSIEGIGFAIPSSTVKTVLTELLKNGEVRGRASIGLTVGAIPPEAMEQYSLPSGLYVISVQEKSDAAAKGILPGDILTAVNGLPVTSTAEVADIKNGLSVGDSLTLSMWRDGTAWDVTIILMETNDIY